MTSNSKIKGFVALAALLLVAIVVARPRRRSAVEALPPIEPPHSDRDRIPGGAANADIVSQTAVSSAASIDNQVCAECHAEIVADYRRNGMSHTWRTVSTGIAPELKGESQVADLVSGYRYLVSVSNSGIEQIETSGDDVKHELRRSAEYLVGSGKNAIAPVTAEHGYLTQMPAAWFSRDHAWRMNPGFELQNHRFDRPITPGCIACHGTEAIHEPPTPNRFQEPVVDGIACHRCHGPTEQHVAFWTAATDAKVPPDLTIAKQDESLSETISLTPGQSNDLCLQCHLQGDVTVYEPDTNPFEFHAGDRLRDHRHDFLVDLGEQSALGVASHGARMLQSRCYTASSGELTCVLCHDPHKPSGDFDADHYDSKCATCHTPQSCNRIGAARETAAATGCVACHMPQRASQEGIHLVFTDHAMVRHKPSPDAAARVPNVLAPNAAQARLVSAWPGGERDPATRDPATLGAAYVLLHETMGPQIPTLERAVELLSEAIRQNPADSESRFWLGSAYAGLGRGQEGILLLTDVLIDQPERHPARFRLAIAYEVIGDYATAITHYQQLVDTVPSWIEPYPRLAQLYLAQQKPDLAERVLKQQLSHHQDALAHAQLALAIRMRGGSHRAAMSTLAEALRLDPRLPTAYMHRAALWLLVEQRGRAKEDFERVLRFDPENQQAKQALRALAADADR